MTFDLTKLTRDDLLAIDKILSEDRLMDFVRVMWRYVEPGREFVEGWVADAIAEHLEAVTAGQIDRLIINVPPGSMKSMLTGVFWPAWEWGPKSLPSMRYLCASYSQKLTIRDNVRFQQVVGSPIYRRLWGNKFRESATDANKEKFANSRTGWKLATSVGGVGTGERGDRVILDDPNNVLEAESDAVRGTTNQWLTEVMPTRVNDLAKSAIICIQQRTHEEDATGTLLSTGDDWVHLMIPMRYDPGRHCVTAIGWEDPREEEGEIAWPERFPPDKLDGLESQMGAYAVAGQHQQAPAPRGGALFKRDWWQQYGPDDPIKAGMKFPRFDFVLASLDTAYTEKEENDYSALAVLGVWHDVDTDAPAVMLVRAWRERLALNDLVERVAGTCNRYKIDGLLVENKAAGIPVVQELRRLYSREEWGIHMTDPSRKGDKVARAHSITHLFEEGMVHAPNTDWAQMVQDEMAVFPRGSHDDLTDAMVQGLRWLRAQGLMQRRVEVRAEEQNELMRPVKAPAKLYPV